MILTYNFVRKLNISKFSSIKKLYFLSIGTIENSCNKSELIDKSNWIRCFMDLNILNLSNALSLDPTGTLTFD